MPNVILTSVHDNLVNYVLAHGLNPNVVLPLIDQAAAEAIAGWGVTGVSATYAESAEPYEAKATTRQFLAEVQGTGEYSQNVIWSISGNISPLTIIDANGLLTVDAGEFIDVNENHLVEHIITITATSVDNQAVSGSVSFTCVTGYCSVIYDANGGTETLVDTNSPYESGATVTILENTFVAPTGQVFDRWISDDVNPDDVSPGATLTIGSNLTIYALWRNIYTVEYNANGGTGAMTDINGPYDDDDIVILAANAFDPPTDKLFLKWNTAADGSGTDYAPAAEITAAANIVLYAQWKDTITSVTITNFNDESSNGTTATEAGDIYFFAVVEGVGTYSRDVTWSMTGHGAGSFISNNGLVTLAAAEFAPPAVDGHTINIIATSVADPTVSDTEVITCEEFGPT